MDSNNQHHSPPTPASPSNNNQQLPYSASLAKELSEIVESYTQACKDSLEAVATFGNSIDEHEKAQKNKDAISRFQEKTDAFKSKVCCCEW